MEKYSLLHRYMTLDEKGLWVKSKDAEKLQSDKQTLLEVLKEAREDLYGLVFVTSDQHLTNEASLEEAEKAVKKYDEIIKANT